jgi:hypothetical protein
MARRCVSLAVAFYSNPGHPFRADDPHEIGQALLPATAALLDGDQVEAASLSEGILDRGEACAGSGRP